MNSKGGDDPELARCQVEEDEGDRKNKFDRGIWASLEGLSRLRRVAAGWSGKHSVKWTNSNGEARIRLIEAAKS
jgi:hypothetical protein